MDAGNVENCDLGNLEDPSDSGIIAIAQSGEMADMKRVVMEASQEGFTTMGVVNTVGSVVACSVKMGVYCHAGNKNGVASTKSFTSQVTVLALISLWF